jgi:hypothetical protein
MKNIYSNKSGTIKLFDAENKGVFLSVVGDPNVPNAYILFPIDQVAGIRVALQRWEIDRTVCACGHMSQDHETIENCAGTQTIGVKCNDCDCDQFMTISKI